MEPETRLVQLRFSTDKRNIERQIDALSNKFNITTLTIKKYGMNALKTEMLNNFRSLTVLDVSNNVLTLLEVGILIRLRHLERVNFNRNLITSIDNGLFEMNTRLTTILLRSNCLSSINTEAFSHLENLQILNLGENRISVLSRHFLRCPKLNKLYLDANKIEYVNSNAFFQLPNLTHLNLSTNRIRNLDSNVFCKSGLIRSLKLNGNMIEDSQMKFLAVLVELNVFHFRNNMITNIVHDNRIFNQNQLTDLDLSLNKISTVEENTFEGCQHLRFLKLTIFGHFVVNSIKKLSLLIHFDLFYRPDSRFSLMRSFWNCFDNKTELTILKLVFQYVDVINICCFSFLKNLECLHIECVEPNVILSDISFVLQFGNMPKLKMLILKRLNYSIVRELKERCYFETKNVKILNLTGIKNKALRDVFYNFKLLEYLNLSFSEIKYICAEAFHRLVHLQYLDLRYSKLRSIGSNLLSYNTKLKNINCANSCITNIGDYAFRNLDDLEILDLRFNILANVSEHAFTGIRSQANIRL